MAEQLAVAAGRERTRTRGVESVDEELPSLFWLDHVQGPLSVPWFRRCAMLPPSAHQVGMGLWMCRNLVRDGGPVRWNRARQRLFGTPPQTARDGLRHLEDAELVRVLERAPGRVMEVELTSPDTDPVLGGGRWTPGGWVSIRGPISRPWLMRAGRARGERSTSTGSYRRPGPVLLVGLSLWAARNRGAGTGSEIPIDDDALSLFGLKSRRVRRALVTLEREGLVAMLPERRVRIISPDPDPVLDGRAAWRAFLMDKFGLATWPAGRGEERVLHLMRCDGNRGGT